jgi:hypothetical protein
MSSQTTTDHETNFPGFSGADSLKEITWEEFFEKFAESQPALLCQDETSERKKRNKLVSC